jgi:hypothetical protein
VAGYGACDDCLVARSRGFVQPIALIVLTTLALGSCGTEAPIGGKREMACGPDVRFDESFLEGPDQSRDRLASTPIGRVLDDFFMAGPGLHENAEYRDAEGFAPISETTVLGYIGGAPVSYFVVEGGRVTRWGGCTPLLVEGDLASAPWWLAAPVDSASTSLDLSVVGGGCVGTGDLTEVVRVDVTESSDSVEIVVWVRETPVTGDVCADYAVTLPAQAHLESPLGSRTLWDGRTIPATAVAR